ncbi:MAG TPA: hypothetical protein VKX49_06600 [Bryobacteraceae bacterium]|nr:hypothetical protein [Bryobacteraceae bacterium]
MSIDDLIITGLAAVPLMLLLAFILPPLQYAARSATDQVSGALADYHFSWASRSAERAQEKDWQQAEQEFSAWLASRLGGENGQAVDEDLLAAQKLIPVIRMLLEDEIPAAIRRCNVVHRKIALLSGVIHMQEAAMEPECRALRRWTVVLLANTQRMLSEYPVRLRLEADELIHASIVLRKSLVPTCTMCPYIRKTVAAAGERCPAAELIQIDPGGAHA